MNRVFEIGEELYEPVIHVKWNNFGALRRFPLAECEWNYQKMLSMIRHFEPNFSDSLCYRDEEGDKIVFTTTLEMNEMISCLKSKSHSQSPTIKIESTENKISTVTTTATSSTATEPQPTMASRATNTTNNSTSAPSSLCAQHKQAMLDGRVRKIHPNVLCDLCDQKICGTRYKCLYCDDFDLCEDCEKLGAHPEHPLLRLATPETPKAYEMIYGALGGRKHGRHHHHHSLHHSNHRRFMRTATKELGLPPLDSPSISENIGFYSAINNRPSPSYYTRVYPSDELLRRGDCNTSTTTTPRTNAGIPVLRPMPEMEHSVIDAQPQPLEKNGGRHDASAPKLPPKNPMPTNRPPTLPNYENARRRLTYLKEIGSHVQKALLNYGIECEATVEDKDGKVHERLPFAKKSGEKSVKKSSIAEKVAAKKTEEKVATASNNADAIPYLINYEREPKPTFKRKSDETAGPSGISTKTPKPSSDGVSGSSPPKVDQEKTKKNVPGQAQPVAPLLAAVNQTAQMATDMSMDALELATQLFMSMEKRELADQTNRIGLSAINGVKSSIESIATNMGPLIADLSGKCRIVDTNIETNTTGCATSQPASSTQQQSPFANSAPPTTENVNPITGLYPSLFPDGDVAILNAVGAYRVEDDEEEELHTAVAPSPIPLPAPEPVSEAIPLPYFVNSSNPPSTVPAEIEEEEDIDMILLSDNDDESEDGGNLNSTTTTAVKTATVVVAETRPDANGSKNESNEEKDSTSISSTTTTSSSSSSSSGASAASFADGNDVDAAAAYSVSDADEWMLVSKSSYKQLCDFYERRRKMDSDGWWDDAAAASAEGEQQLLKSQDCEDPAVPVPPVEIPETSGSLVVDNSALSQPEETKREETRQQKENLRNAEKLLCNPVEERMMKCFAGKPYYEPQQPHRRRCHITHSAPEVQSVVDMLVDMGYDNCNGWLTRLVERSPDDIAQVLDKANADPVYQARLAESD